MAIKSSVLNLDKYNREAVKLLDEERKLFRQMKSKELSRRPIRSSSLGEN